MVRRHPDGRAARWAGGCVGARVDWGRRRPARGAGHPVAPFCARYGGMTYAPSGRGHDHPLALLLQRQGWSRARKKRVQVPRVGVGRAGRFRVRAGRSCACGLSA